MVYEFFVGFNEEICKAVTAMLVIKRLGDLDEPIDALIYSMTVALGFAILENVLYAMHYGPGTLIIRHFMSVPIHMSLAALWGIGVMHYYFNNPDNRSAFRILTPYVLSASLTHTLYNYFAETDVINAAFFVFVLVKLADSSLTRLLRESPFLKEGECPYCGRFNVFFTKKCAQCGEVIESDLLTKCSGCDTRILKQSKVCPECGLEH